MSSLGSVLALHVLVDRLVDDLPGPAVLGPRPRVASRGRPGPPRARACGGWPGVPRSAVPSSSAARTAQPGSPSWRQSLNRQVAAMSTTSSNAASTPSSAPRTSSARMPGVSTSSAPPGSSNSSRWVVVWRPRESESRTSAGRLAVLAEQRVDQRRLADARRAEDRRGRARAAGAPAARRARRRSAPRPRPSATPGAIASTATSRPSTSSARSDLLRTTTGRDLARPGDREIALDAAQVEVVVEARRRAGRRRCWRP